MNKTHKIKTAWKINKSVLTVSRLMLLIACSFINQQVPAASNYELTHSQWSLPKSVDTVLQMSAIKNTLSDFDKSPDSQLLVLYPGGDEGTLWAHEVKAWLVSLGISSRKIELRPGSRASDSIELRVDSPIFGLIKSK